MIRMFSRDERRKISAACEAAKLRARFAQDPNDREAWAAVAEGFEAIRDAIDYAGSRE